MVDGALFRSTNRGELDLLAGQLRAIHCFRQHLDSQLARLIEGAVLVVVLLEQRLCTCTIRPDTGGLPAGVVAAGVRLVELEVALVVPAGIDEGNTKGAQTTMLRVALLEIAQTAHELLAGNVGIVGEQVALRSLARVVDENVGISGHARDSGDHVVVEDVQLLGARILLEQLAGDFPFGGEHDAVGGEDAEGSAGV